MIISNAVVSDAGTGKLPMSTQKWGSWGEIRAGELHPHYYWQLEQQLLVSGAERVIFACSDGTRDNFVHLEYTPVAGRREQLVAGWAQFEEDLGSFQVKEVKVEPIGAAPDQLPALRIDVTGMVTASNLDSFKAHALSVIGNISPELSTDKDFADADAPVEWCGEIEDKLKAAKEHALSQTESMDVLFKAIDDIVGQRPLAELVGQGVRHRWV